MEPQSSTGRAGGVHIFATHGGTHSAQDWAEVTAEMIVTTGADISPPRMRAARELRARIVAQLTAAFQSVGAKSSGAEIDGIANAAAGQIAKAAAGSPWEMEFGNPEIAGMILDVVRRNLATHADIALRTE